MWNLPVHFWFIRHLYNPLLKAGCSRARAEFVVFLLSALGHEYLISAPLGVCSATGATSAC
jgi:diacylglycerol O-acyltransferase 1